jgi:hypothetical protein
MSKKQFQSELLAYTHKRLNDSAYKDQERSVQLAYQMGILIGLLYDLAESDNYNAGKIKHTLYPEQQKNRNTR